MGDISLVMAMAQTPLMKLKKKRYLNEGGVSVQLTFE